MGWVIDKGETSFSKMGLGCGSMLPRDKIGPPKRSACWSILILLGLYVYRTYLRARIGPIPAATMSCNGIQVSSVHKLGTTKMGICSPPGLCLSGRHFKFGREGSLAFCVCMCVCACSLSLLELFNRKPSFPGLATVGKSLNLKSR